MSQGRDNYPLPAVNVSEAPDPEGSDAVEEKRRAARRRFLLGGASALPVIVSVAAVKAQGPPVGLSVCASILGRALTPDEAAKSEDNPPPGPSLVCDFTP